MMEQRGNSCSITRQWWNSGETAVPSPDKTISKSSQQGASVSQLPAALRRPQKNTPLDFGSMHLVDLGDGTVENQLFHHQTMLEQREVSCSITRQCWNSGKPAVPSPPKTISKSMRLLLEFVLPYPAAPVVTSWPWRLWVPLCTRHDHYSTDAKPQPLLLMLLWRLP